MNAHVGALKAQHQQWREVRSRLFNPPPKLKIVDQSAIEPPVVAEISMPRAWQLEAVQQDWHVQQHNRRLSEIGANPPKAYVKDRCVELGVSFADIIGSCRRRKISLARHQLMYEVSQKFGLSYPAMGRLFGHRDHTSCLYAVRKMEALQASQ